MKIGSTTQRLADHAIFLRAMAVASAKECLESRDECVPGKEPLLLRLVRRCTATLGCTATLDDQPFSLELGLRYDKRLRDTTRTLASLLDQATPKDKILASAEELTVAWACFFYLHSAAMHKQAFRGALFRGKPHGSDFFGSALGDDGLTPQDAFERVGVAVTEIESPATSTIAYVVIGHEDAFTPWFYDKHCVGGTSLPSGLCAFDPVTLADGHSASVDPKTYGSPPTTWIAWLA